MKISFPLGGLSLLSVTLFSFQGPISAPFGMCVGIERAIAVAKSSPANLRVSKNRKDLANFIEENFKPYIQGKKAYLNPEELNMVVSDKNESINIFLSERMIKPIAFVQGLQRQIGIAFVQTFFLIGRFLEL